MMEAAEVTMTTRVPRFPRQQPRPWQVLVTTAVVAALVAGVVIGLSSSGLTGTVEPPIRTAVQACRFVVEHSNPPLVVGITSVLVAPAVNHAGWAVQVNAEKVSTGVIAYSPPAPPRHRKYHPPHWRYFLVRFHAWNGEAMSVGGGDGSGDHLQNHAPLQTFGPNC
jgi:hypothetical protein